MENYPHVLVTGSESGKMNIALDFDGTYTELSEIWDHFIKSCLSEGHKVYLVTFRSPQDYHPAFDHIKTLGVPIIMTDRNAKREYCKSIGININIWIDDNPDLILQDSDWTDEELEEWRKHEILSSS